MMVKFLKAISILILIYGIYVFLDFRLWKDSTSDFSLYMKTFLPILVVGFSTTIYGISCLLEKKKLDNQK